jgi:2-polyprenyl-6-methoxyphenol hydroxylase-like FAD-dependent oxidoreductase
MDADVAIIGGGPAGSACAIALSLAGVKCVVVERSVKTDRKAGEIVDSKICIPLRQLGLWEKFASRGYLQSAGTSSLWGTEIVERSSSIDPYGGSFFIDRRDLEELLLEEAAVAGANVIRGAAVRTARKLGGAWSLQASGGASSVTICSPILIEASGRGRAIVGPADRRQIDSLTAIIAYPDDLEKMPDQRFCIEATETGWWYAAVLPGRKKVLAFLTDTDLLPPGRTTREKYFTQCLGQTRLIQNRFGKTPASLKLKTVSAASSIRNTMNGDGWVSLGEAAATYDPLTGVGIYAALTKGLALSRLFLQEPTSERAFTKYALAEKAAFEDYLSQRRSTYSRVEQWKDSNFWRRRQDNNIGPDRRGIGDYSTRVI